MAHPQLGERIYDSVDHSSKRWGCTTLSPGSYPVPIRREGHFAERSSKERQRIRARYRVIHEARRQQLPALRLVIAVLKQRLADPLGNSAMRLTMQDQRINCASDVVNRSIAHDLDLAGVRVALA